MKDFESFIKSYSTRDFIYFFSEISIEIFKKQLNCSKEELKASMTFPLKAIMYGFMHKQVQVMLSAWDIQDIAYLSIKNANDYRKEIMTKEMAGTVINLYRGYENEHSNSEYIREAKLADIFKFMMGMTYEQFKYQNLAWTYQSFNRNYHILIGSDKINRDQIIDINNITKELFDLNVDEFLANMLILWWLCSQQPDPLGVEEDIYCRKDSSILTKENLKKIISYYSVTYEEVRESKIKKQLFYSKPFVITKKKSETLMISMYLVQMLLADCLYWLIRDYYCQNGKNTGFINAFGIMFEEYFEELAGMYLREDMWHKIPEKRQKSADFFVVFEEVVFLFELKSGLLGIAAKQQTPDVHQIDVFYKRNILEAYEQLNMSEKEYDGTKPVIKIFLLYESMTNTQLVMSSLPEIFEKDTNAYVMTIEDLEMLLVTYKNDKEKFTRIVQKLVNVCREVGHSVSVLQVLNECGAVGDLHFVGERDYYNQVLARMKIELND